VLAEHPTSTCQYTAVLVPPNLGDREVLSFLNIVGL
jgi:hypothetical protein